MTSFEKKTIIVLVAIMSFVIVLHVLRAIQLRDLDNAWREKRQEIRIREGEQKPPELRVVGITYSSRNKFAVIDVNRSDMINVREGAKIGGVTVTKIEREKVEFKAGTQEWVQAVQEVLKK